MAATFRQTIVGELSVLLRGGGGAPRMKEFRKSQLIKLPDRARILMPNLNTVRGGVEIDH